MMGYGIFLSIFYLASSLLCSDATILCGTNVFLNLTHTYKFIPTRFTGDSIRGIKIG